MTRAEFEREVNATREILWKRDAPHTAEALTEKEYKVIEKVYTYHPEIDNVNGKEKIALLFAVGGMTVIGDMLSTALTVESLENDIEIAKSNLNKAKQRLDDFIGQIGGATKWNEREII